MELSSSTDYVDPVVKTLTKLGIPVMRKNYLELAYPEGMPEKWTAELEAALPEELQNNTLDEGVIKTNSRPSFADGSSGLQWLKRELLAKGMSDDDVEAYLRQI